MPDLLSLTTEYWLLSVWSRDVEKSRAKLRRTLAARGRGLPKQEIRVPTATLEPSVAWTSPADGCIELAEPVFFENQSYEFEFTFKAGMTGTRILHIQKSVEDAFRIKDKSVRGTINFGNDVGWFKLRLCFDINGQSHEEPVSFQVLPTKMDMATDMEQIHEVVDKNYPLWRFAFGRKTEQELAKSRRPHERFPLLWLAQFEALRQQLSDHVRVVCNAPHNRLKVHPQYPRIDRLKGKLSTQLEQRVSEALARNDFDERFKITTLKLSVDTPENRFIKMALKSLLRQLISVSTSARALNKVPDKDAISESFFNKLGDWQRTLSKQLAHPLFSEVGNYDGTMAESQVLFQRAGYAGVYRIWQEIKGYLDVFGDSASIAVKSVAELYEVWCLLEIRRHLLDMGFKEVKQGGVLYKKHEMEKMLNDSIGATFNFERDDGLHVRLAHEPLYGSPDRRAQAIYSWNARQKPDIVLQAIFPNGERIHWIFDAKYRVDMSDNESTADSAPEDALNQMHRYRDALIFEQKQRDGTLKRSRPFIGAYVLYPGWFTDECQTREANPYGPAIEAVNIGAFPVLPSQTNVWLRQFLDCHLKSLIFAEGYRSIAPDEHLSQNPVRIPPTGLSLVREGSLVLVAQPDPSCTPTQLESFVKGTACWYEVSEHSFELFGLSYGVIQDLTHVALAVPTGSAAVMVSYVYRIQSVKHCNGCDVVVALAAADALSASEGYCLFELGKAITLNTAVVLPEMGGFRLGVCTPDALDSAKSWSDISGRYTQHMQADKLFLR